MLCFVSGHDFSRAHKRLKKNRALAPARPFVPPAPPTCTYLPSLTGEQNHFLPPRRIHRSNCTAVLEWYGPKPVHDRRSSPHWLTMQRRRGASPGLSEAAKNSDSRCSPGLLVRGSGVSTPLKSLLKNKWALQAAEKVANRFRSTHLG
jgi:hypothetical protein